MGKMTLILGGARSGKSAYALQLAGRSKKRVAFIATCRPSDKEMKERVRLHQSQRPRHWRTFEETENVASRLQKMGNAFECIVIDCLTLLVSNLMLKKRTAAAIGLEIGEMTACLKKMKARAILVSNEVGLGIVPDNKLARDFRDIAGRVNQRVAREADEVFFMVSGLPLRVKIGTLRRPRSS
jgi:adenosylcobinamide kinase / adenosylcobinamide-phosphate guanylyltransferase